MKDFCVIYHAKVDLLKGDLGIGTGLAGERENAITLVIKSNKSEGGEKILGDVHAAGVNAYILKGIQQQMTKGGVSHLADKGSLTPNLLIAARKLAGAPPG